MERTIDQIVFGQQAVDGGGVHLVRVLGSRNVRDFDPFLMLDSFDSTNPADYTAGFPRHPHRGLETISYVQRGQMIHSDSLGFEDTVSDGEIQYMTAGSGILHEEKIPAADRLLGVQLWLNLPAKDKLCDPAYTAVRAGDVPQIDLDGGVLRVLMGSYGDVQGTPSRYLPFDYYNLRTVPGASVTLALKPQNTAFIFTLEGQAQVADEDIPPKAAALLTPGDSVTIDTDEAANLLIMSAPALHEPVSWMGPMVMNTSDEIDQAYRDLRDGTFVKKGLQ
jgi:redox-sensitive bicupin YhaK (pirin superfamily)